MVTKAWKIIPRPILETVLNTHVQTHRVHQPLILHGPRGVGKTTLILHRLLDDWNKGPHVTGYVDLAESITDHHPRHGQSFPWASWSNCTLPSLPNLRTQLEQCLESMAQKGVRLGNISSDKIFATLKNGRALNTALRQVLATNVTNSNRGLTGKVSDSALWGRALCALSVRLNAQEKDDKSMSVEEASHYTEGLAALKLAKEVIRIQQGWRANAVKDLNQTGGFSKTLANLATDWPCLLLELLSAAAENGYFQPKLVINNIDVLKNAVLTDDSTVCASMFHDSLIWRIIALGANDRSLPVILVTSDSYYSYRAYMDYGFPDIFISRETFGWSPQEAQMHMVTDYYSQSEWNVVAELLGPNPRHLFELYALKQSSYYLKVMGENDSTFEDIVDAYLAYLQVTVVNPAMDKALSIVQKFAVDAQMGRISKDKLRFGAPWRHPPRKDNPTLCLEWAKIQLMDFIQSFINTEFGVNYLADCSLEILDDPCALAMMEVGLVYAQRDPSFIRPISRGIQRCLVRWLVQERMQMSLQKSTMFLWQRVMRGRNYRHLMLQVGYK